MSAEPIHLANATPFDLIVESINDLIGEARNYADGAAVETQGQADDISRIIEGLNQNAAALDAERVKEKAPLDAEIKLIQDRYNAYIADRKNKNPGSVWKAVDALKACLQPYLARLDAEKRERERIAREAAEAKAREAEAAIRAAAANDLGAREDAETKVKEAAIAEAEARKAVADKAQASGGNRAMGLRSVWKARVTDPHAAAGHYWRQNPEAFNDLLQKLANDDVRGGKRSGIPGVEFYEDRVL
ncbi:hypothetical protein [Brevundimonas sp. GCM10030266]|uniref:hypothetical protein n=1 Tax=Brevundimonas sp. GCM10030266 TaxID=3273386 RepID=UPI00361F7984